jgi:mono/diheme cytochrome c family protein
MVICRHPVLQGVPMASCKHRGRLWPSVTSLSTAHPIKLKNRILLGITCLTLTGAPAIAADNVPAAVDLKVDFERDVAPILRSHCVDCHGPNLELGSLRLDEKKLALDSEAIEQGKGGES